MSLEEVTVRAEHKVLMEVDLYGVLIVGITQRILGKPCPIHIIIFYIITHDII